VRDDDFTTKEPETWTRYDYAVHDARSLLARKMEYRQHVIWDDESYFLMYDPMHVERVCYVLEMLDAVYLAKNLPSICRIQQWTRQRLAKKKCDRVRLDPDVLFDERYGVRRRLILGIKTF
jgi:hypothetical protein